ncbi:MAG TPA: protein phosphatase 2C domain-containing protein [Ktedonobacterales bacterium]
METDKQQDEPTAEASQTPAASRDDTNGDTVSPSQTGTAHPADSGGEPVTASGQSARPSLGPIAGSGGAPLAPGTRVGSYTVGRLLRDAAANCLYVATSESGVEPAESAESAGEQEGEARYLLQELPAGTPERALTLMMSAGLQHPRLLVPTERVSSKGRDFVVLAGLPASSSLPRVAAQRASLDIMEALRAGAGLADALSYLHRNGFAHLHVAPEVVVLQDDRAYLAGVEHGARLDEEAGGEPGREAQALVAQDANDLGRTLGSLAHVSATPRNGASEAEQVLATLAAQGAAGALASPDEVAALCGAGLQATLQAVPPPASTGDARLRLLYGVATTVGAVRSENQDAAAATIFNVLDDAAGVHSPMAVFLVADGMGGEAHGELASRIAARTVPAELMRLYVLPVESYAVLSVTEPEIPAPERSTQALAQALNESVAIANGRIRDMADYFRQDTGTTLTAIAVAGHEAIIAHVGDSRAYLLRDGSLIQLTEDHTLLARLQAMDHPILSDASFLVPRNFLYRSLGQEQSPPDLLELALASGDRLLICSDGLWDELDDATLQRELAYASDPTSCAQQLVTLANEAGGHDNSTALVLFVLTAPQVVADGSTAAGSGAQGH